MFENMSLLSSSASNANALEQLVNVAQGLNASDYASAVELIRRAIESPLIYSFGELLDIPLIASVNLSLKHTHTRKYHRLQEVKRHFLIR